MGSWHTLTMNLKKKVSGFFEAFLLAKMKRILTTEDVVPLKSFRNFQSAESVVFASFGNANCGASFWKLWKCV